MLDKIRSYIQGEGLIHNGDKVLLAVSGGMDSVVLARLFSMLDISFGIAHCNFQLRGEESEEDERFVKALAGELGVEFHSKRFDTNSVSKQRKESIQVVARDLRYAWFGELCRQYSYNSIAVAHHLDDNIETMFINLLRGTGVRGVRGMLPRNEYIIRPLLFATREQISGYAAENGISYREDSSNQSRDYLRNKLRLDVLPILKELKPSFSKTMAETIKTFRDYEVLISGYISTLKDKYVSNDKDRVVVDIAEIRGMEGLSTIAFELLREFGFPPEVVQSIVDGMNGQPGKVFYSKTHQLLLDRDRWIITTISPQTRDQYSIDDTTSLIQEPIGLKIDREAVGNCKINPDSRYAFLDYNMLKFPLTLRRWREGDAFHPLGMKGRKKLSDFFIDLKVPVVDKENKWVLTSGKDVVWVVGSRIDNNYRLQDGTREVLILELISHD